MVTVACNRRYFWGKVKLQWLILKQVLPGNFPILLLLTKEKEKRDLWFLWFLQQFNSLSSIWRYSTYLQISENRKLFQTKRVKLNQIRSIQQRCLQSLAVRSLSLGMGD